ncbi:MAG: tetratricopeptide repeat protein [Candidatus Methylomirabilia bacterium]
MWRNWGIAAITIVVCGLVLTGGQVSVAAVKTQPGRSGDRGAASQAEFHYTNGLVLSNRGQLDHALLEFQEALRLKPDYVEAHTGLGAILAVKERLDEAIREFQEALRLEPTHADAHLYLGLTLARKAEVDRAIQELEQGLRLKRAALEEINPFEVSLVQVVLEQLRFIKKQDEDGRTHLEKQFETLQKDLERHQAEERRNLEKSYRDALRDHEKGTKGVIQSYSSDVERRFRRLLTIKKLISP